MVENENFPNKSSCVEKLSNYLNEGAIMSKGLDGRSRDEDGQIREKRGDTLVKTLRKEYGPEFAEGYRSDTKLETVRENEGKSLSQMVKGN